VIEQLKNVLLAADIMMSFYLLLPRAPLLA